MDMKREELYAIISDQQQDFEDENPSVKRTITSKATELLPLKMPIVITGIRRCGKSFLLKIIKDKLNLGNQDYLYVNFNDERLANFSLEDFQKILDFIIERGFSENCVLFLDEIQETDGWEKWIDRIRQRHSIFISGSNSKLLSSEISSILTGRSISLHLMPFDFSEFLASKHIAIQGRITDSKQRAVSRAAFGEFLVAGGLPQRVMSGNDIVVRELYENILYRDIIKRFGKLSREIKEIGIYLLSNPSSPVSMRTVSAFSGIKNLSTLKRIFEAFENAFLFFFVSKIGRSVKKQIQNPKKAYCVDNGFLSSMGFRLSEDKGRLLENLVAIELKRGKKEFFYYSEKKECDFVVRNGNAITEAIQVCYELNDENREREFGGLNEAMNEFGLRKGIILTYDQEESIKDKELTISILPVWKWLLDKSIKDMQK